jgi:hypothetical protein
MLETLIKVFRVVSLAILCAGSMGFVFAAVTGVKSAEERGIPVAQAATANAPVFVEYAKAALVLCIFLLFLELLGYAFNRKLDMARKLRFGTSAACFTAAAFLALAIVPRMEQLIPEIQNKEDSRAEFHGLHNQSRVVVSAIILFAFASIAIPLANDFYQFRLEAKAARESEGNGEQLPLSSSEAKIEDNSEEKSEEQTEGSSKSS